MDVERDVKRVIAGVLHITVESITLGLSIGDVEEWDSMGNIAIIATLEEQLDVEFPVEDLFELTSVEAFVKMIKDLKK